MKNLLPRRKTAFALCLALGMAGPAFSAGPVPTPEKERAVSALEQDVKNDPNNPELWLHLGFAYRKTDRIDKARDAFEKSASLAPGNRDALYMLALIYENRHEKDKALKAWNDYRALETDPEKRQAADKHIHTLSQ